MAGKKPHIEAMYRDGACFFCEEDRVAQIALTPMTKPLIDGGKISGTALYLCDDCHGALTVPLGIPFAEEEANSELRADCQRLLERSPYYWSQRYGNAVCEYCNYHDYDVIEHTRHADDCWWVAAMKRQEERERRERTRDE